MVVGVQVWVQARTLECRPRKGERVRRKWGRAMGHMQHECRKRLWWVEGDERNSDRGQT